MNRISGTSPAHADVQVEVLEEILASVGHTESGIDVIREIVPELKPAEDIVE
jgi:hypothetical protein